MGRFSKKRAVYSKKPRKERVWSPDGYLKSHIRKIWRWSPARRAVLRAGACKSCARRSDVLFADHTNPVVDPTKGWEGWDIYIKRMFEGELQPLCESCHKAKTAEEAKIRAKTRKAKKETK